MKTRYVGTRLVPLGELTPFPGNARRGDVSLIAESIERNGQYRSLVVRQACDGAMVVLAGNHTLQALSRLGRAQARCEIIECDDATATRINLVDNKAADVGDYDREALAALLTTLEDDLTGTGYAVSEAELFTALPQVPEAPPSLDALAEQYGEPQETDLWPVIRVRVPPNVRDDFHDLTKDCEDPSDDSVRFMFLVQNVRGSE